jgi:ferritin-like metal-binding protein YciE
MGLTVSNPRDLLLVELADILFVERLLSFEVLPELLKQVSDPQLVGALAEHLEQTKRHVGNVEAAFRAVGAEPSSSLSKPFVGLKDQHAQIASSVKAAGLADLWHAAAAIHTEHYEIAAYRQLRSLASALGLEELDRLLAENLRDEEEALERLERAADAMSASAARGDRGDRRE